jgi:DNA-binding beta-propeller fold protein YncE
MKIHFGMVSYLWILLAMPLAASTTQIWATYPEGDTIWVIDTVTNKIVHGIKSVPKPHGVVFNRDGSRAYVASETSEHSLYVMDTKTLEIINKVVLSGRPNLPAITKDGSRVYVCIRDPGPAVPIADAPLQEGHWDNKNRVGMNGGAIDIVDTASLRVKSIPLKASMHNCYLTPDEKYLVGGSHDQQVLIVIDLQTEQLAWEVRFDRGVQTISIESNPDGSTGRVFPQLYAFSGTGVVDFAAHKELARIRFPEPSGGPVAGFKEPNTHGSAIPPDGKTIWFVDPSSNAVFVYSLPELKLVGNIPMCELKEEGRPASPGGWITFTGDGKRAYLANKLLSSVDAIDAKTMKKVATIPIDGARRGSVHTFALVLP